MKGHSIASRAVPFAVVLTTLAASAAEPSPAAARFHVSEDRARAHVLRPANVMSVVTDHGIDTVNPSNVPQGPYVPARHLAVAKFGSALHASLKDSVAGYAMQLRQHGAPIYTLIWNWAETPADAGIGWSLDTRHHIASVSKLLTAMALTKALDDHQISWDAKIAAYLPAYWSKGPNVDKITFRQILTMTSGLYTPGTTGTADWQTMRDMIAAGASGVGTYHYANADFGLCRVMLAIVNGDIAASEPPPPLFGDLFWDLATIDHYGTYMQSHVFGPSGVTHATLVHPATGGSLAYTFPASGPGWNSGDLSTQAGSDGWHMTMNELLGVMGTFRRKGTILSSSRADAMLAAGFGLDLVQATAAGTLYEKTGMWGDNFGRTEQTVAYVLPEDMEMAVFVSSPVGKSGKSLRDVVTDLYVASLE